MNHRYEFLDGLRGVAAIVVVLMHSLQLTGRDKLFIPHAQLAVDFFFCLSGFVLAHAYGAKLKSGTQPTIGHFYLSRLIRLYPMLILGLVAGTAFHAIRLWIQNEPKDVWDLLSASLTNLFLLPSPLIVANNLDAWPANPPQWSLFFEFLASFAFPWLVRLNRRALVATVVLTGMAVLALGLVNRGIGGGSMWKDLPFGLIRVAYPFAIGIYLCSHSSKIHRPESASGLKSTACVILLVAILFVHVPEPMNGIYEAAAVLVLIPALMLISSSVMPTSRSRPFIVWLGAISYPLYATHHFVILTVAGLSRRLERVTPWHYGIVVTSTVAACLLIAWVCLRKIDEPVRRWLTVRLSMAGRTRRASIG